MEDEKIYEEGMKKMPKYSNCDHFVMFNKKIEWHENKYLIELNEKLFYLALI